jgi:HEAT repeat protein
MFVRQNALIALSEFGKDAEPLIPAIAEMLNDREHWVQTAAMNALGRLHANFGVTIPALTRALGSTNIYFALDVARTLQGFGPAAQPAVPAMIEALKRQTNELARSNLRSIIDQIEPGAVERAGIK